MWLPHLSFKNLSKIDSIHYTALRIGCFDFKNKIPRSVLDHNFKRATPSEWKEYCISREYIRIYITGSPRVLFERLDRQSYRINRPDWFYTRLSHDAMRIKLKQSLFKYPTVLPTFVPGELCHQIARYRALKQAKVSEPDEEDETVDR